MASIKFTPAHPSAPWRVYHRGKSYWLATEAAAKKKAEDLEGGRGAFSARELDEYRHAKELLQGASLLAAVRAYVEFQQGEENITVAVAIKRFLEGTGGRPDYVEKKSYFLSRLRDAVGDKRIGAVTPSDILAASLKFRSDWMKNDFVRHAGILFRYCIKMRITRNNPTGGVAERKVKPSKIILSLPDTEHLLATCKECLPEILPAVALQLFMGIRTTEVCRLEWSAVKLGEHVDISPEVSKTHERRVIDWWPPRLTEYIGLPCNGTVVPRPRGYEHLKWELVRLAKKSKPDFVWGQNAARHSFASYGVALWQNAGKIALLMGQRDINVLYRHYRSYRTAQEGAAYFGLKQGAQVLPIQDQPPSMAAQAG